MVPAGGAQVGQDAVVVEADAIKNRDAVYRALTSMERSADSLSDVESLSSYVHEYSTKAAEALLVAAGARPAGRSPSQSRAAALRRRALLASCCGCWRRGRCNVADARRTAGVVVLAGPSTEWLRVRGRAPMRRGAAAQ